MQMDMEAWTYSKGVQVFFFLGPGILREVNLSGWMGVESGKASE